MNKAVIRIEIVNEMVSVEAGNACVLDFMRAIAALCDCMEELSGREIKGGK